MGSGWASDADSTNELNASSTAFQAAFAANGNSVADPGLTTSSNIAPGVFDLIPTNAGNVGGATPAGDAWFTAATYKGAFDPAASSTWVQGWTRVGAFLTR